MRMFAEINIRLRIFLAANGQDPAKNEAGHTKNVQRAVLLPSSADSLFYRFHITYRRLWNKADTACDVRNIPIPSVTHANCTGSLSCV